MITKTICRRLSSALILTLLGVLAFPSCNCKGTDGPTPPEPTPETKSLIASMKVSVEGLSESRSVTTVIYDYDSQGRVIRLSLSDGEWSDLSTIQYGEGTITLTSTEDPTPQLLHTDKAGRLISGSQEGMEIRLSYDTKGRVTATKFGPYGVTYKWGADRLLGRSGARGVMGRSTEDTFTYTDLKDPVGLPLLVMQEEMLYLPAGWLGTTSAYLPAKCERRGTTMGNLPVLTTTTYTYTLDGKGRPTKILMVDDFRSLTDKFRPDVTGEVKRVTIELTYLDR